MGAGDGGPSKLDHQPCAVGLAVSRYACDHCPSSRPRDAPTGGATPGHTCRGRMLPWVVHRSQSKTITFYSRKYLVIAQFLAVCRRSQWSRYLTTFPLLALAPGTLE